MGKPVVGQETTSAQKKKAISLSPFAAIFSASPPVSPDKGQERSWVSLQTSCQSAFIFSIKTFRTDQKELFRAQDRLTFFFQTT
jgi:hypothetical protein